MEIFGSYNSSGSLELPAEITKILNEVARTGHCEGLHWVDGVDLTPDSTLRRLGNNSRNRKISFENMEGFNGQLDTPASSPEQIGGMSAQTLQGSEGVKLMQQKTEVGPIGTNRLTDDVGSSFQSKKKSRKRSFSRETIPESSETTKPASKCSIGSKKADDERVDRYECYSEGASTATNSELGVETQSKRNGHESAMGVEELKHGTGNQDGGSSEGYKSLQDAFRIALHFVLEAFYEQRGGYRLSPVEKQQSGFSNLAESTSNSSEPLEHKGKDLRSKDAFINRRNKLVEILQPKGWILTSTMDQIGNEKRHRKKASAPPFTLQRVAEVLLEPERYYTQTHKLCNCLEKLLLVTSSSKAFGGGRGGDTSQSRREERELTALANERDRQQIELRSRSHKRRAVSPSNEVRMDNTSALKGSHSDDAENDNNTPQGKIRGSSLEDSKEDHWTSRETLEAAARASLRTKFDHVGIDPHSAVERDVRCIAENRSLTNSPPPPSLTLSAAATNMSLQSHGAVPGFVRQHLADQVSPEHHTLARIPSPILFAPSDGAPPNIHANMQILQLHNPPSVPGGAPLPSRSNAVDLMTIDAGLGSAARQNNAVLSDIADAEIEHGRSSASNSDVDSESDDISLDDSASDRSDGSDSGGHYEQFTAARAMALSRMQQQQRLQNRVLTGLGSLHQSDSFRPPADSEYQSGDSIDSMRAEDSGGSDSSSQSSDIAD